jgi:hypothetical protein
MWLSQWQRAITTWALPLGIVIAAGVVIAEMVNLKRKNSVS